MTLWEYPYSRAAHQASQKTRVRSQTPAASPKTSLRQAGKPCSRLAFFAKLSAPPREGLQNRDGLESIVIPQIRPSRAISDPAAPVRATDVFSCRNKAQSPRGRKLPVHHSLRNIEDWVSPPLPKFGAQARCHSRHLQPPE